MVTRVQVISGCSSDMKDAPGFLTKCVLDIDIYKNRPSVHEHVKVPNPEVRVSLSVLENLSFACACWYILPRFWAGIRG